MLLNYNSHTLNIHCPAGGAKKCTCIAHVHDLKHSETQLNCIIEIKSVISEEREGEREKGVCLCVCVEFGESSSRPGCEKKIKLVQTHHLSRFC